MTDAQNAMGLLYTTWPDEASAQAAARTLLEDKLIACANILGPSTSIYRWQGKVENATEIVVLFKTGSETANKARDRIAALHPYDEPAILNLAVHQTGSSHAFLDWVRASVTPPGV
jgi:periplasmic divalent cation tolerance protein